MSYRSICLRLKKAVNVNLYKTKKDYIKGAFTATDVTSVHENLWTPKQARNYQMPLNLGQ